MIINKIIIIYNNNIINKKSKKNKIGKWNMLINNKLTTNIHTNKYNKIK